MSFLIFDFDGTLVEAYMDRSDRNFFLVRPLPRRIERLALLRDRGHTIAVATNQAAVAFNYVTEQDVRDKLQRALLHLMLPSETIVKVCYAHPKASIPHYKDPAELARRKPSGAMLLEITGGDPDAFYIGDREEDEQAARAAGIPFCWTHSFFNDPLPPKQEQSTTPQYIL